jgi:Ca-activated chloride channel family protein
MEVITRVILFTDGAANHGPVKTPADILALVAPNIGIASVSAFGYGQDAQQSFLLDLSKSGKGNYSYVQNPDDALSAFGKELGGLLSTHATGLTLEISPLAGHEITQVISDVEADEEDIGQVTIKIPDVLAEETRHVVLGVKLKAQKNAFPREVNVFDVKISYDVLDATLRRERKTLETKAKVQFVKAEDVLATVDPDLDRVVGLAQIVRAQIEAEEHAKRGNYAEAAHIMHGASANVGSRGMADLGVIACNVADRVSNQSAYLSSGSYLASITRGGTRGYGGTYDAQAAADLQTAGVLLSNSSQVMVESSFTTDPGTPGAQGTDAAQVAQASGPSLGDLVAGDPPAGGWGTGVNLPSWPAQSTGGAPWVNSSITVNPVQAGPAAGAPHAIMTPFLVQPPVTVEEKPKRKKRRISQKSKRW